MTATRLCADHKYDSVLVSTIKALSKKKAMKLAVICFEEEEE